MRTYIEFEKPIAELESRVAELRALPQGGGNVSVTDEIATLEQKARQLLAETYAKLTPWQKTQVAR
ncbi:MAG: acetyl-CoA carboxylase carboxyl transferase subunit alpha, partial [Aestuariivirga sp.]